MERFFVAVNLFSCVFTLAEFLLVEKENRFKAGMGLGNSHNKFFECRLYTVRCWVTVQTCSF